MISPLDVLFFRNGTPFNAGDSGMVRSIFPPTPSTAYGVARGFLLLSSCSNFNYYINNGCDNCTKAQSCAISEIVGHPTNRDGRLSITGPYIMVQDELFFPAPADLFVAADDNSFRSATIPKEPVTCDLGLVRLPKSNSTTKQFVGSNIMIPESILKKYLKGESIHSDEVRSLWQSTIQSDTNPLIYDEYQFGIAIDRKQRSSKEGYLYAIEYVRPSEDLKLWIGLDDIGSSVKLDHDHLMRFGGEGKQALVQTADKRELIDPMILDVLSETGFLKILLLQHADFSGRWLLPGFEMKTQNGVTSWKGELAGYDAELITASVGQPVHLGGWDTAARMPRPMKALVPSGSVYYLKIDPKHAEPIVNALHGSKIGYNTKIGYGHIAIGVWSE